MGEERPSPEDAPTVPGNVPSTNGEEKPRPGKGTSPNFFANLLAVQCRCSQAQRGAILQSNGDEKLSVLAVHPQAPDDDAGWLQQCANSAKRALTSNAPLAVPLQGNDRTHVIFVPLDLQKQGRVVETFLVKTATKATLESTGQLLQLTAGLVSLTHQHLSQDRNADGLKKLRQAMETLSAANRHNHLTSVAMSVCNELAAQWKCERVSLGFLKGRYVRVKAISHTENFSRKMRLVQDIEVAMEECLDQDSEVLFPALEGETCVSRAAEEFSSQHNQEALLSLPLRYEGEPKAVITLERPTEKPFAPEETEAIRLTCDLCTPRLMNLHRYDRWLGARAAAGIRRGLGTILGAEHTWAKLTVVVIFAVAVFLVFAKGQYRVKAPFIFEAVSQYKITAPFDGYIKDVTVEVGDPVTKEQTQLAELDTAELRLQLASARAEQAGYLKQVAAAMRDSKTAEAQIAQANADKTQALIDLHTFRIEQATILSPLTGTLITGDLKRQIGAPVETGTLLFEIAPLDSLRAELYVPEDEVSEVTTGQQGYLATASFPGQHLQFIVERVNPAAEVVNNRNVFKVRVRLLETRPWIRPGMEGVAKVTIEKRHYAWIWSRKVVNWIRMKLWI